MTENQVTLPTSTEVRERLEKAGYHPWHSDNLGERWAWGDYGGSPIRVLSFQNGAEPYLCGVARPVGMSDWLEAAVLLGIAPPGYRLVPDDVALTALPLVTKAVETAEMAETCLREIGAWQNARAEKNAWQALATALSPSSKEATPSRG